MVTTEEGFYYEFLKKFRTQDALRKTLTSEEVQQIIAQYEAIKSV